MTREEASNILDDFDLNFAGHTAEEIAEAFDVAFKALSQEPKTGHWIDDKCSVCGKGIEDLIASPEWYRDEEPKFCPFCGIKLVNPQESEG